MQVDLIKPTLKAPGTRHLELKSDILLSNFAFKFNSHCYSQAPAPAGRFSKEEADKRYHRLFPKEHHGGVVQVQTRDESVQYLLLELRYDKIIPEPSL